VLGHTKLHSTVRYLGIGGGDDPLKISEQTDVTWDGRTILSAPIQVPLGQSFQFTAPPSEEEAHVLLITLRGGRLPVAVKSLEYRSASTKS